MAYLYLEDRACRACRPLTPNDTNSLMFHEQTDDQSWQRKVQPSSWEPDLGSRPRKRGMMAEGWERLPSHWRDQLRGLKLVSARANMTSKWLLPCTPIAP